MKKLIAIVCLLFATTAQAGEKEELTLKKENLELQAYNIQLSAQLMNKQMADIQGALKIVTEKLQVLERQNNGSAEKRENN